MKYAKIIMLGVLSMILWAAPAQAQPTQVGISISIDGQFLNGLPANVGNIGDQIKYLVTVSLSSSQFPIINGEPQVVLPNGVIIDLANGLTLPTSGSITFDTSTFAGGVYTISAADLGNNGTAANKVRAAASVTATSQRPDFPQDVSATANFDTEVRNLCISVTKTPDTLVSKAGDVVNYTIVITNCSDTGPIAGLAGAEEFVVSIIDTLLGDLTGAVQCASLQPGASCTITVPYTVKPGDIDPLPNTVTVVYEEHLGSTPPDTVTASASALVDLVHPGLDVVKECPPLSKAGDIVDNTVVITNTGDIDLIIQSVTDSLAGPLTGCSVVAANGGTCSLAYAYTVKPTDLDPLINQVTVVANVLGLPNIITEVATCSTNLFQPSITLEKSADTPFSKPGDTVNYTFTVRNTSSADSPPLDGSVTDSILGAIGNFTSLPSGQIATFTKAYVVQAGDSDPLVNTATVTASPEGFPNVLTASATASVDLVHPCISIEKHCAPANALVGDTITYTFVVTNCGDVDLENITVSDSLLGDISALFAPTLAAGASDTKTATRVVLATDPDPVSNTATVNANVIRLGNSVSATASCETNVVHPCISIEKQCAPSTAAVGDTITYTITIANCGDVALENVIVTDTLLGDLSSLFVDTLAVGASDTKTTTRVILAGDPSPLPNTATVDATVVELGTPVLASASCEVTIVKQQGCTPGFWKNHPDCWTCFSPSTKVGAVFTIPGPLSSLADKTLLEALAFPGGKGVIGKAQNLLRAAVAALENSCNTNIGYPLTTAEVISQVNAALASLDQATITHLQGVLDADNNLGCPIDAHCNPILPTDGIGG